MALLLNPMLIYYHVGHLWLTSAKSEPKKKVAAILCRNKLIYLFLASEFSPNTALNQVQLAHRPYTGLILGLRPTNERRYYIVTMSLIDCVQA